MSTKSGNSEDKSQARPPETDGSKNEESETSRLVKLAKLDTELWHDGSGEKAYATIQFAGHIETYPLESRQFKRLVEHRFYVKYRRVASTNNVTSAISNLEGEAFFNGKEYVSFVRIAGDDQTVHIDLGDTKWRSVTVTASGVAINPQMPVKFIRRQAMTSLPVPSGADLELLRKYINIRDADWPLLQGWLLACLRPTGPYPLLVLSGEQGSAKSTTAKILRALIDPNRSPIRAVPRSLQDLAIAANNGHIIALDNLSSVPIWLSDGLCRIATGGGFATRALYANDEEIIFEATRPIILTGIEDVASRADLADRSIAISLPAIPSDQRRSEKELWENFEQDAPAIFGGLLNLLSASIRNLSSTHLKELPRMADFAQWATAAEQEMGLQPGEWMELYLANINATNQSLVDDNPIIEALRSLLNKQDIVDSSSGWLKKLNAIASEDMQRQKQWPQTARKLSGELRRLAPVMRRSGIQIDFESHSNDHRKKIAMCLAVESERSVTQDCSVGSVTAPETEVNKERSDTTSQSKEVADDFGF